MSETGIVSKSVLAIVGIGIAGCLLLSLTMRQLVQHQLVQRDSSGLPKIASRTAEHLTGPLAMHEEHDGAATRLVVSGRVAKDEDKQRIAAAIAVELWERMGDDSAITEVQVTLRDEQGKDPVSTVMGRPSRSR